MTTTLWTVEPVKQSQWSSNPKTLEEAQALARKNAYQNGDDYYVMAPIAIAHAPAKINDIVLEAV